MVVFKIVGFEGLYLQQSLNFVPVNNGPDGRACLMPRCLRRGFLTYMLQEMIPIVTEADGIIDHMAEVICNWGGVIDIIQPGVTNIMAK